MNISIKEAPPTLIGALPTSPPKKRRTNIVCRFFASAAPMLNRQKARVPEKYTGERPMDGRFDNGES